MAYYTVSIRSPIPLAEQRCNINVAILTLQVTAKSLPKGAHDSAWRKTLLSPHFSLLSPRFGAVGPSRPSLVRGLRPRNAPSPTTSRRSQWVGNTKMPTRVGPRYPPPTGRFRKCASASKTGEATPLICPTFTAMTIESPLQKC